MKFNKVKKDVHNSYCSDKDYETFFPITIHYDRELEPKSVLCMA